MNDEKSFKVKKGFTLAEVLITLAVIGVVAALTIPSLLNDTNDTETVSKLKKAFSTLSNATKLINLECGGGSILNCLTNSNAAAYDHTTTAEISSLYKDKLNFTKECGFSTGCFPNVTYKFLNGTNYLKYYSYPDFYRFLLNNGTSVVFYWTLNPKASYLIVVDLDNKKGLNQLGRDTFLFSYNSITNNLEPLGVSLYQNDCNNADKGHGCAAKVLTEGAINY